MAQEVEAPITGKIWKIEKQPGDVVATDDVILVIESMKMEIPIESSSSGTVRELLVSEGDQVQQDSVVAILSAK